MSKPTGGVPYQAPFTLAPLSLLRSPLISRCVHLQADMQALSQEGKRSWDVPLEMHRDEIRNHSPPFN